MDKSIGEPFVLLYDAAQLAFLRMPQDDFLREQRAARLDNLQSQTIFVMGLNLNNADSLALQASLESMRSAERRARGE